MTKRFWWMSLASLTFVAGCDGTSPTPDAGPGVDAEVAECAGGAELCGGACVDVSSDRNNCGACGTACGAAEACVDGVCGVGCPASQVLCGDACIDTTTDRRHCGACDASCGDGEICAGGACEISCPSGQTDCDGACADTNSHPANCGGCGLACAAGELCSEGACATACGTGLMECSAACVDTMNSPDHCGACDASCATPAADANGFCVAGSCRSVCDALYGDCNADLGSAATDGCETPLATDPVNCGACNRRCSLSNASPGCDMGECVVAVCAPGFGNCDSNEENGCEARVYDDPANCGACGTVCAGTDTCIAGACAPVAGEDCSVPIALSLGANTVRWTATLEDYLTLTPSCSGDAPDGGDVVMSYTAGATAEHVTISIRKPEDNVWTGVLSTAVCGTITETACLVADLEPAIGGSVDLAAGETVYLYLSDTNDGDFELSNPLDVTVAAIDCATDPPPSVLELTPANGSVARGEQTFSVQFGGEVDPATGTVTITGDMGTALSYDLSTSPAEIDFYGAGTLMEIDPGIAFPQGESLTLSWTGLVGAHCAGSGPVTAPTWGVTITTPSCMPGVGGMVGSTATRISGAPSVTEYYVAADDDPAGYVYVGGTSELFRVPKAGGASEDIEALASLTSTHLGYEMVIAGRSIYTIDSTTSGNSGRIYRISSDGGATWLVEDYATFPSTPNDDFQSATVYQGRIYMATEDFQVTEIWSMPAESATVPVTATLELTIPGVEYVSAIARDSSFYYLVSETNDVLWRMPTYGGEPFGILIEDEINFNGTQNDVFGADLDGDGLFDVLYAHSYYEEVHYVCDPATPFTGSLYTTGGTGTSNYGLGFDRMSNTLWMFDDGSEEFISIQ